MSTTIQVDNIAIIITDGKATRDVHLTRKYAQESKNNGVRMLAVGITSSIDQSELEALASYPESFNTFNVAQFTELTDIVKMLLKQTCEPVMTTAPPTSVTGPQSKWGGGDYGGLWGLWGLWGSVLGC